LTAAAEQGHTDPVLLQAAMRMLAGVPAAAQSLLAHAADHGHAEVLPSPALLQEWASDLSGLEATFLRDVNGGGFDAALSALADLRELAGDRVGANQMRRHGLTDHGHAAPSLYLEEPNVPTKSYEAAADEESSTKILHG
jgi:hypothetical protein